MIPGHLGLPKMQGSYRELARQLSKCRSVVYRVGRRSTTTCNAFAAELNEIKKKKEMNIKFKNFEAIFNLFENPFNVNVETIVKMELRMAIIGFQND